MQWMLTHPLQDLMAQAKEMRDARADGIITFSPKAFLPVTKLCRNACGYCTFAQEPQAGRRAYMTVDEILHIAHEASESGCSEALVTLGDKPELLYPTAQQELANMGFETTIQYIQHVCAALLMESRLIPHVNAGVMSEEELSMMRDVSASQGLMLETTAEVVLKAGGAHHACPDKEPASRLRTIHLAGVDLIKYGCDCYVVLYGEL
jgi:FO synthase